MRYLEVAPTGSAIIPVDFRRMARHCLASLCIIALLASCATVEQPKLVSSIPPPKIVYVDVPVRCVKAKPEVPKTVITAPIMAGAEAAVAALASPPPEITKEQLSEWIGAIDKLVASLLVDLYKLKSYAADADPKLTECMIDPEITP
jgi:hypothetical protein